MAMVAENDGLVTTEGVGDRSTFVLLERDTTMVEADLMVVVKAVRSSVSVP